MDAWKSLTALKQNAKGTITKGLGEDVVKSFLARDPLLKQAILEAHTSYEAIIKETPDLAEYGEKELIERLQSGFVNFYAMDARNPYVSLAARGPWVITFHGAVIHDSGGYGMLGHGHAPQALLDVMSEPHVMANIMTANYSQLRLTTRLQRELGHTRKDQPFAKFICVNSGSESVSVATRISDINTFRLTGPSGPHAGKRIMFLAMAGGFHGRTDRPAQASSSTMKTYKANLASFRDRDNLKTIEPNHVSQLEEAFLWAEKENVFFDCVMLEPVMGEGDPGKAITPEFYQVARRLSAAHGSLLLIDSIQASIRAHGCVSIVDYPGFQNVDPPDMETFSKALNGGQYPMSVLALNEKSANLYVQGVYGNTMTANPKALEVACVVLDSLTDDLRNNIRNRGQEFVEKLKGLQKEFPQFITKVQGTGLLCSAEIAPQHFKVVGFGHLEEYLRINGIGVIHGGTNSLRFTPHFRISSEEIDLVIEAMRDSFKNGPRLSA